MIFEKFNLAVGSVFINPKIGIKEFAQPSTGLLFSNLNNIFLSEQVIMWSEYSILESCFLEHQIYQRFKMYNLDFGSEGGDDIRQEHVNFGAEIPITTRENDHQSIKCIIDQVY